MTPQKLVNRLINIEMTDSRDDFRRLIRDERMALQVVLNRPLAQYDDDAGYQVYLADVSDRATARWANKAPSFCAREHVIDLR